MEREAIIEALKTGNVPRFIEEFLFDRIPYIFANDRTLFVGWKRSLASALDVDPACLTLVGSAAVGLSLSPLKNFKPFDQNSDIDVAVVSAYHFTVGWRYLRTNGSRRMKVDERTKNAWDEHTTRLIYWGTLATDKLLGVMPFGAQWQNSQNTMRSVSPTNGRTINFRIYTDHEALRAYQRSSLNTLRDSLFEKRANNA